jgi:DNA polymerase-3 subunit epsilon
MQRRLAPVSTIASCWTGSRYRPRAVYQAAAYAILEGPPCPTDYAANIASRAAHQAGLFFEKAGDIDLAEQLFRAGSSPECHERLARLLYKKGEKAAAETLIRQMIDDPASDDEFVFATDFYARKFGGRRTALCTDLLRSARTITVDDTHRVNPEAGVAGVMRRQGWTVFFAENTLWLNLFGLLFWDELFESGQLHSGFDWTPHCLKDRSFVRLFATQIETKLAAVRAGSALPIAMRTVAAGFGRPNGVFAWKCQG